MAYAVVLSESAAADIMSISEHIAADNPRRAHSFVSELRNSVEKKLAAFPRSGVAIGSLRYTTFGNYVIVYRIQDASMIDTILLVTEGHRDWRRILDV